MTKSVRKRIMDSRGNYCPPTPLTNLVRERRKTERRDEFEALIDPLSKTDSTAQPDIEAGVEKSGNVAIQSSEKKKFVRLVMKVTRRAKGTNPDSADSWDGDRYSSCPQTNGGSNSRGLIRATRSPS